MGCLTLRRMDLSDALAYARQRIRCYNEAHGNLTGYHETITVAFLTAITERLERRNAESWESFRIAHSELVDDGINVLLRRYTREILFFLEARASFVSPDAA